MLYMKRDQEADRLLAHTSRILAYHSGMLADSPRNRAFYQALEKHVTTDSRVLDIGSGTGIWAIVSAKLGAKRVLAVEKDRILIPVIKNLVRHNGVADKVEVVEADSTKLKLNSRERFDIIVSETIGNQGFDEQIVPTMLDARRRFLKPGGTTIPSTVTLVAAPSLLKTAPRRLPVDVPIEYGYFESISMNVPRMQNNRRDLKICGEAKELLRVDFAGITSAPNLNGLTANWRISDTTRINSFAIWARSTLTKGVEIDTLQTRSWSPVVYLFKPFKQKRGRIEFKLSISDQQSYWMATLVNGRVREEQSFSQIFAYASLQAGIIT
jgi:protein arginine N-methyltransferase 1